MGQQSGASSNMANRILGFIKKGVSSRTRDIIIPLYSNLVMRHLEYAVQFWSTYLKKDIEMLERIHYSAAKMVQGLAGLDYDGRLKDLGMCTLQERRIRV